MVGGHRGPSACCTLLAFGLALLALPPSARGASEYDEALSGMGEELAACMGKTGTERVAAVDFTDLEGAVSQLGRLVAEELSTELVRKAGDRGYQVVDRNHLQVILKEYKLDTTGLINPENSKRLGKFAGIDTLITGNIFELEESIRITAKALDTETAGIKCASRGDARKTLALREAGAIAPATVDVAKRTTASQTIAEPVHQDEHIRVSLRSIRKSRNGRSIQLVVTIENRAANELRLALDAANPPALFDDLSSDWRFQKCTGIDTREVEWDSFLFPAEEPRSSFRPGSALPVSCSWEAGGEGSAATSFSFTSSLVAQFIEVHDYGGRTRTKSGELFLIPVGLTDIRPR